MRWFQRQDLPCFLRRGPIHNLRATSMLPMKSLPQADWQSFLRAFYSPGGSWVLYPRKPTLFAADLASLTPVLTAF